MLFSTTTVPYVCSRCIRLGNPARAARPARAFASSGRLGTPSNDRDPPNNDVPEQKPEKEQGAMSRRLAAMSEDALETGGRSAQKAVEEAGFNEDLKRSLQERIAGANLRNEHAGALAQANLPTSSGREIRETAAAEPWSGTETVHDASLRMLNGSIKPPKPIRGGPPRRLDTGRPSSPRSSGARLANARDQTSAYAYMKELPDDEREKLRQEMKERFTPSARSLPVSIQGLESLANQRIEEAIARGKFKNLPRGKVIERDYNASSPFINTTEYLLNRMIQKQDIVPPWIEKQQEIVSTIAAFRGRLRADWKRHVSRNIASRGGSLESQMQLASDYARAELVHNPQPTKKLEKINTVTEAGHLSQLTLAGELKPSESSSTEGQVEQITVVAQSVDDSAKPTKAETDLKVTIESPLETVVEDTTAEPEIGPFRDPAWLSIEKSYHQLAIENLNSLTRGYNLMCPALAQRPYFALERELNACYAEVAPQIADAIRERAWAPRSRPDVVTNKSKTVLDHLAGPPARVYDEVRPQFGFRELWRDWFGKDK